MVKSIAEFYSNADTEDGFGATGAHRSNPHRGIDLPWPAGTEIPALVGGTVGISEYSKALGWVTEVHGNDGLFYGYRHQQAQGRTLGEILRSGEVIGRVGSTGTASTGAHLCFTVGTASGAVFGVPDLVRDPYPFILSHLAEHLETEQETTKMMIRDEAGSIYIIDTLGADHLGDFGSADIDNSELIDTGTTIFGAAVGVNNRQRDLLRAIASRRWERKRNEIAAAVKTQS